MRYSILVILIFFASCNFKNEGNYNKRLSESETIEYINERNDSLVNTNEMYIPNTLQDSLFFMIPINVADSLIKHSIHLLIKNYKSSDINTNKAIEDLKLYLLKNHNGIEKLIIDEIRKVNESIIEFHVIHFDDLVLRYNYDIGKFKKYRKIIGDNIIEEGEIIVTGNPTGKDCIYTVDLLNKTINADILQ
ncbi:MAG: hypothetical protein VB048_06140 [Bacteroidaceae bacterium]|nr:hypothetical protein [Bacteroidaceae bacterium]MEA4975646.1 hypothetical protein [Paludibacter sp.]